MYVSQLRISSRKMQDSLWTDTIKILNANTEEGEHLLVASHLNTAALPALRCFHNRLEHLLRYSNVLYSLLLTALKKNIRETETYATECALVCFSWPVTLFLFCFYKFLSLFCSLGSGQFVGNLIAFRTAANICCKAVVLLIKSSNQVIYLPKK